MFNRRKNGRKQQMTNGAIAKIVKAIGKYRQSEMYVCAGRAMNETDESIVAKIDIPATNHGTRCPPRKKSSADFSLRAK